MELVVIIGIGAGACVFMGTLLAVFFLLQSGGSFDRMKSEAIGLPNEVNELKPVLYDELLAAATQLPDLPPPLDGSLQGEIVWLRELKAQDMQTLFDISNGSPRGDVYGDNEYDCDDLIWRYLDHGPFRRYQDFERHYKNLQSTARLLVIIDATHDCIIGMLALCRHSPQDLRIAVDHVWLAPAFQNTKSILPDVMLILLTYLFETQQYRRVEYACDGHNVRARRAGHSLGLTFEGVQRKHRIVKKSNWDTCTFAAINSDWPLLQTHLRAKGTSRKKAN